MPRVAMNFRFFADWLLQLDHPISTSAAIRNHVS